QIAVAAWWELDPQDRYPWDHLIEHLIGAGRTDEAEAIACDLRWIDARLLLFGPAAPYSDLLRVETTPAHRRAQTLAQVAHLLTPVEPSAALVDVLHSRVAGHPDWTAQVAAVDHTMTRPRL